MDALDVERFGSARALARELIPRGAAPPPVPHRRPSTWEEYRDAFAAADARLAEATRNGRDDSWWEEPDA